MEGYDIPNLKSDVTSASESAVGVATTAVLITAICLCNVGVEVEESM